MKNLTIYISPVNGFDREHEELTKIQIDNSLELGWKVEDLILATNFDWEYKGVKSLNLKGDFNALDGNRSSKILVINRLFDMGKVRDGDVFWFHDHDAFQLTTFEAPELYPAVAAFTDHGWSTKWNAGSFFFNRGASDLFREIYDQMIRGETNEQDALTKMWEEGWCEYKMLNITYNLNINKLEENLKIVNKPLLVAHFHPHKLRHLDLFRSILPERLLTIFQAYGIK
jgi:hypothetical protein